MLVPPEILVGTRLVLRRSVVADAEALTAALAANLDHLRPWLGWASAPDAVSVDAQRSRLRGLRWQTGEEWAYLLRDPEDDRIVGGCGLMPRRGPGRLEIGYWVDVAHTGRGLATEAARLLTGAARRIDGIDRVWILTDEANVRSAAVPRRLGYVLDHVGDDGLDAPADTGRTQWWRHDVAGPWEDAPADAVEADR